MTKELLNTVLAKQCCNFQPASYTKLQVHIDCLELNHIMYCFQEANLLLGKTQTATDQLLMLFITATQFQLAGGVWPCLPYAGPPPPSSLPRLVQGGAAGVFSPLLE